MILPPLKRMNGFLDGAGKSIATVLVTGIRKEELAFGKQVSRLLVKSGIQIVVIDNGLSHERAYCKSGFYHSTARREKLDLLIDLHTGINETGRCVDILSANTRFLKTMDGLLKGVEKHIFSAPREERLYEIIQTDTKSTEKDSSFSVCHTIIPEKVWNFCQCIHAGLKIYLNKSGQGSSSDWEYSCRTCSHAD